MCTPLILPVTLSTYTNTNMNTHTYIHFMHSFTSNTPIIHVYNVHYKQDLHILYTQNKKVPIHQCTYYAFTYTDTSQVYINVDVCNTQKLKQIHTLRIHTTVSWSLARALQSLSLLIFLAFTNLEIRPHIKITHAPNTRALASSLSRTNTEIHTQFAHLRIAHIYNHSTS
jgi:hypothetical protein